MLRYLVCFLLLLSTNLVRGPARAEPSSGSPPATLRERVAFAVVVGNNQSLGRRRPELRYADDDAARYFEILQTLAPGRVALLSEFDRDTERLFPAARQHAAAPSQKNLAEVGRRLAAEVRAAQAAGHETELYFVFAGHGDVEGGEGFIELSDARFRSSELEAFLKAIPFTRAHVILDSCNSFFMLGVRKPGGRHFATSEDATRALASRLSNVGVFLSTSADGEAFEWSEIQSGIFSHVVRSGLLGGADANGDGQVSYLELAAFVDTATIDVKNPNMRPHVFARGPGARDETAIAPLSSMVSVRQFELTDAGALRVRLRDASGVPLLDVHSEPGHRLALSLPESWAAGAVVERSAPSANAATNEWHEFYTVPEAPEPVTLATLARLTPRSTGRGPDETFQALFAQPFGPSALAEFQTTVAARPVPVYGVSREDLTRMELLLDGLSSSERGRRVNEALGGIGFGVLLTGAGIGVLQVDPDLSRTEKRDARIAGGVLLGLGGLFVIGGTGSLLAKSKAEETAVTFHRAIASGQDPGRAFAEADRRVAELIEQRREERLAAGFFGALTIVGCTTGLVWSEVSSGGEGARMAPRLGWGGGIMAGGLLIGEALLTETPVDTVTKLWRDDPSLIQYQPSVGVTEDGAYLGLSGTF